MDLSRASAYRLDWITSFVAVAHEGGFSAAGKSLFRSQPRVSSHVSELERLLGVKLFDRSVHPAALTPEGRALLPHAEEVLARLDLFAEVVSEAHGGVHGEVHVGMYPSAAAYLYPPLVRRLRQAMPTVTTVLREGDTLTLEKLLVSGDVDVAVRPVLPLVREQELLHTSLWEEPLVAVVPAGHPLAGERSVSLRHIADHPLITIGDTADGVRQFETNLAFAEAGLQPTVAHQTNQPQTMAAMVRAGLGIGVTNALAMTTANCNGVTLVPTVTGSHVHRHVALWWHGARPPSAAAALVRDVITRIPAPKLDPGAAEGT